MSSEFNDDQHQGISRRRLMGAATASALGLAALATDKVAAEGENEDGTRQVDEAGSVLPTEAAGSPRAEAVPAANPAYSYRTYGFTEFHANYDSVRTSGIGGAMTAPGDFVWASIDLPVGSRLREFTAAVNNTSGTARTIGFASQSLDGVGGSTIHHTIPVPNGTTPANPITAAIDVTLSADRSYWIFMITPDVTVGVHSVRFGFEGPSAYVPVDPYRAYDSRKPGVPSPGKLTPNTNRVVKVLDSIDATGAVVTANVIPANARAVSYNLTATGITGPNYLSVTPGSAAAFTVSSINFTATDIANGGIVRLSTGGNVKVFCGDNTGSTDFIIDITGYYI